MLTLSPDLQLAGRAALEATLLRALPRFNCPTVHSDRGQPDGAVQAAVAIGLGLSYVVLLPFW